MVWEEKAIAIGLSLSIILYLHSLTKEPVLNWSTDFTVSSDGISSHRSYGTKSKK